MKKRSDRGMLIVLSLRKHADINRRFREMPFRNSETFRRYITGTKKESVEILGEIHRGMGQIYF